MANFLIITVGGSHQPVLQAIRQYRPEAVYFLCSGDGPHQKGSHVLVTGEGKVTRSGPDLPAPDGPNIVTLAGLRPEQANVRLIERIDDLDGCYAAALAVIGEARAVAPEGRVIADYTAGTKSMSAGLALAAVDDGGCELSVVTGPRTNLVKVPDRTEVVRRVLVSGLQARRRLREAAAFAARFDHAAAEAVLREAAADAAPADLMPALERGIGLCRAFDHWDRFAHAAARDAMAPYGRDLKGHFPVLKALAGEGKPHGFEWVEDLLFNAERRYAQGRFDDAVGRVYRAVELTAQAWLRERHGVDTGGVDLGKVPESARPALQRLCDDKGAIKAGLVAAWDLAASFPGDPLGATFTPRRKRLLAFLEVRNQSLLAHGTRPVSAADYDDHVPGVAAWLREAVEAALAALGRRWGVRPAQFPRDFLDGPG